ncbi:MAG TPA: ribose 5-phosphate isomerase B [Paludibacteraceae bacterium]|nr:ribose 5-phosphate isomerase B [Paludibacteraceae bacterium]HPH63355.1 ribose 5-phosphate isomerase B [Paludibacteraceae bacterium]
MKALKDLTIGICNDHAGVELKNFLMDQLKGEVKVFKNFGTDTTDSCDYPDFAHPLASAVEKGECDLGIAICGTGNGISMTCNKHQGIRAALCWEVEIAKLARQHNDANVIGLPARFISKEKALELVRAFLTTDFEGGRHERRIAKIPVK